MLKTLGFSSGLVMALILVEAAALAALGGLLGLLFASGAIRALPSLPYVGDVVPQFPGLGLSPRIVSYGPGVALLRDCWPALSRRCWPIAKDHGSVEASVRKKQLAISN